MEYLNKRTQYTIVNRDGDMELRGEVSINDVTKELTINGYVITISDGSYINNYYYAQKADGRIDKSMTNMEKENEFVAVEFLNATIAQLRLDLNLDEV